MKTYCTFSDNSNAFVRCGVKMSNKKGKKMNGSTGGRLTFRERRRTQRTAVKHETEKKKRTMWGGACQSSVLTMGGA